MLKKGLFQRFDDSVQRHPARPALVIGKISYTYKELSYKVNILAQNLTSITQNDQQWIGILSNKSVELYSSILGILKIGRGYVPLNPKFPSD
ncbi:MAG: AMP-binding protein, partial [Bacteroidetes bacterium]|nr:AMP-binding protein [Bacteroidota bacterium]